MRRSVLREVAARAAAGVGVVVLSVTAACVTAPWASAAGVPSEASVDITSPEDGQHADVAKPLPVTGQAAMPDDGPTATNVYFLVDISFLNAIGDQCGEETDSGPACALEGVGTLNGTLGDAAVDVSVIAFSGAAGPVPAAAAADASPAEGDQPFTTPDADVDDDGVSDIDEVLDGTSVTGFEEFTAKSVGPGLFADYDAALAELDRLIGLQPEGERNIAFVTAVGDLVIEETAGAASSSPELRAAATPEGRAQATAAAVGDGLDGLVGKVTINTFAMPSTFPDEAIVGCEGSLGEIAEATGGICLEEPTEDDYVSALEDSRISVVKTFTVTVNGEEVDSELALDGGFSATVPADTLEEGENTIVATAVVQVVSASASASARAASVGAQAVDVVEASDTVTVIGTVDTPNQGTDDGDGDPAPTDTGGARGSRSDSGSELPATGTWVWRMAMLGLAMVLAGTALLRVPQPRPLAVHAPARPSAAPTRTGRRAGVIAAGTVLLTAMVVAGHRSNRSRR